MSLSWDGTKRANDLNRIDQNGNGTYERIEKAYRLLIDNDLPDVRVRGTFNSDTIEFLMESIENFCSIDPNIDVIMIPDYYDLGWTEEKLQKLSKIVKLVRCNTKFSHIMIIGDAEFRRGRCSGGESSFHIYVDGKIYPCSFVVGKQEFEIGDLKFGLRKKKIEELSSNYDVKLDTCDSCDYQKYCISNKCRYLNWTLTGDFNCASSLVCQFENIKIQ